MIRGARHFFCVSFRPREGKVREGCWLLLAGVLSVSFANGVYMHLHITNLLAVGLGGAAGAILRYLVVAWVGNFAGTRFPWGTLCVNLLGSLALGICYVVIVEKLHAATSLRPLLMVGFLGAFTTFSTFSVEVYAMLEKGNVVSALAYILLSVILCVFVSGVGIFLTRQAIH